MTSERLRMVARAFGGSAQSQERVLRVSAVGGLGVRSAWANETGRWRALAHRSDARRVGRCERRLAGTASPLGRGRVRANSKGVGRGGASDHGCVVSARHFVSCKITTFVLRYRWW
jgi:hypothetical protein